MELSEEERTSLVSMVTGAVWSSGDFRSFNSSELRQAIKDGVDKAFEKIRNDEKPNYYFSFQRLLVPVPVGDGDELSDEVVKKAEKNQSYMQILAKDEAAALHEAGRISAASGSENIWLFVPESITPASIYNR